MIGEEFVGRPGVAGWDPLRIVIDVRGTRLHRLRGRRRAARGLRHPRRARHARDDGADPRPRPAREDLERFAHDFAADDRAGSSAPGEQPRARARARARSTTRSSSRRARRSSARPRWSRSTTPPGRVSAESIAGYPPGIPALLPGERITAELVAYLRELQRRRRPPARRQRPGVPHHLRRCGEHDGLERSSIDAALAEDVGAGDVTAEATVDAGARGRATITQKAPGVISGLGVAEAVFRRLDPGAAIERLGPGGRVARGRARPCCASRARRARC